MLTLPNTVALVLASTFVTFHVAALPRPQEANAPRAVDVAAFTPWEIHRQEPANAQPSQPSQPSLDLLNATPSPAPKKDSQINDDTKAKDLSTKRGTNPEGFVPYMHFPSSEGGTSGISATNPAIHEVGDPEKPGAPLAERDDHQTVVDENRNEKAVNVVPIVGEKRGLDTERLMESPNNDARRDLDPAQIAEENRNERVVNITPIVGEKRGLRIARPVESPENEAKRDLDPAQIAEENRNERVVNITPIVGEKRGLNTALPQDSPRDDARRDLDAAQIIEANRNEKEVDVVPIVGRAVDVAALASLARRCGANDVKYDPSKDYCDGEGNVRHIRTSDSAQPNIVSEANAEKREAISDKLSCNGERYLPSEENCTADGLVSLATPPMTPSDDVPSSHKRAAVTAQCGSGVGSISYDRSTSYCDPITKQVSPIIPMTAQGRQGQSETAESSSLATLGQQRPQSGKEKRDSATAYEVEFPVMEFKQMYEHMKGHSDVDSDSDDEDW